MDFLTTLLSVVPVYPQGDMLLLDMGHNMNTKTIKVKLKRDTVIDFFEKKMLECKPTPVPVRHIFTPGLYTREVSCAAGTLLTSAVHKHDHPFVLSKGTLKIYGENGEDVRELKAPYTGITKAGTRRLVYIVTDVVFTTFHVTNKTDIDEIEEEITESYINPLIEREKLAAFTRTIRGEEQISSKGEKLCLG